MKKFWIMVPLVLLLSGCAAEETFETVADELVLSVMASPRQFAVVLPEDAAAPVLESDSGEVFLGEGYEILLDTLPAGDLSRTVRSLSGYEIDKLTLLETQTDGVRRCEFVWACAGEKGDRLGRAVILDDGSYHYCLSALWDAEAAEKTQPVWDEMFASFCLS